MIAYNSIEVSYDVVIGQEVTMKRVAIYLRVSTDKQTTDNQRRELEAVAKRSGWKVVKVYEDAGISGAKPWRALCREIILCATRLAILEDRARKMLEPIAGVCVVMPMGTTIGSGLSLLGIGDPLIDMRTAALKEKIVTDAEIRKAPND